MCMVMLVSSGLRKIWFLRPDDLYFDGAYEDVDRIDMLSRACLEV